MTIERLMELLDKWKLWMHTDNHRLGYPIKSILLSSGGDATNAFDEMYEASENDNVKILDAAISDLNRNERQAIYHRYLNGPRPMYYELKLEIAIDNLLKIIESKINA